MPAIADKKIHCYHCGEECVADRISSHEKIFCCEGCKLVYEIINQSNLCKYYSLNDNPGINQRIPVREDKFAFLDDAKIQQQLISFKDDNQTQLSLYLPQMHCSSCLYLLENLHRLKAGIITSKVNFTRKEVEIAFLNNKTSLRKCVELLTSVGYEPYISLSDLKQKRPPINKSMIYQIGVAGFCFGNIMLMSFPEYLGIDSSEVALRSMFRWANFFFAIPVLLYSSLPFYQSSWKSLRHRFLNIDAPITLAIIVTFARSAYEVISGHGGGYFDSMTGIVFFMLTGRILQDKTYRQLSFERDYTSYFPIAVSILKDSEEIPTTLPNIRPGDTLLIHNEELIPADGILTKGKAFIDYSFVTGESLPVLKEVGEIVYAGGKQSGGNVELLVVKEVAQSYLTKLWSRDEFKENNKTRYYSFVHALARYFTYILFFFCTITAIYWWMYDPSKIWPAVTAMLIIACPCALLLSNTFTNGNVLRILGRNHFYLRNAQTIESLATADHIVFDKTGTLTSTLEQDIIYTGKHLTAKRKKQIASLATCSKHPLSRALAKFLGKNGGSEPTDFTESTGKGISGIVCDERVKLGSGEFVAGLKSDSDRTTVYVSFDGELFGSFHFENHYRRSIDLLIKDLKENYTLSVISGDNNSERKNLQVLLGHDTPIFFGQKPEDKLQFVKQLQENGHSVMMIGDGLNDAGALRQSNVGIAVAEQTNNFTPASDAIIEAKQLPKLNRFISLCKANKNIVMASFVLSIVYNIIGLSFAVQGTLSPLIAAILMPSSSLSILLITFGSSNFLARWMRL
ncbi:MAG TPA: heavy metal translocating P-type ATPase metal-binding domain-containing protein [Chitinophagaceae bacterium]|nr:heavy metal translocating P-type ATPase metal-binding domain-containing protein [Chitinophagaceae bacterium]